MVFGIKATSVDLWQEVDGMDRQRVVERTRGKGKGGRRAAEVENQSASCSRSKYLEVLK